MCQHAKVFLDLRMDTENTPTPNPSLTPTYPNLEQGVKNEFFERNSKLLHGSNGLNSPKFQEQNVITKLLSRRIDLPVNSNTTEHTLDASGDVNLAAVFEVFEQWQISGAELHQNVIYK